MILTSLYDGMCVIIEAGGIGLPFSMIQESPVVCFYSFRFSTKYPKLLQNMLDEMMKEERRCPT